jgi:hypothetical protein
LSATYLIYYHLINTISACAGKQLGETEADD